MDKPPEKYSIIDLKVTNSNLEVIAEFDNPHDPLMSELVGAAMGYLATAMLSF